MKIAIIGAGNVGSALGRAWLGGGDLYTLNGLQGRAESLRG